MDDLPLGGRNLFEEEELDSAFNPNPQRKAILIRQKTLREGQDGLEKRCTFCGEWLPFSDEYWYSYRAKHIGYRRTQPHCRFCDQEKQAQRRAAKAKRLSHQPKSFFIHGHWWHFIDMRKGR